MRRTLRPARVGARWLAAATLAVLVGAVTGCAGTSSEVAAAPESAESAGPASTGPLRGIEPDVRPDRPSFVLHTLDGKPYDFAAQTEGRPTLVYFGYTSCPDECPTAMSDVAAALRRAPDDLREQVQVVFVTVDPERDTPAVLGEWLGRFSPDFVALTGSEDEVLAAQQAVGLAPSRRSGPIPTLPGKPDEHAHKPGTAPHTHTAPLGYGVDHANVLLGISAADQLVVVYTDEQTPADIRADLPALASTEPRGDA